MNTLKNTFSICGASLKVLPLAIALACGVAHADDTNKIFSYSGFGTIGAVHSSSTDGDYVGNQHEVAGAGRTDSWSLGVDSRLGLQVNGQFTDKLSGIVQVIVQDQSNNTVSPRIEWANLQYAITPDLRVRVGRIALPTFMVSDTRLVGYSNPWIRPPLETYDLNSITNSDGADASYKMHFGSVSNTVQILDGRTSLDSYSGNGRVSRGIVAKKLQGITDTLEYGALTARVGMTRADLEVNLAPGYKIVPPLRDFNFGIVYDPGTWFVQGEISKSQLTGLISDEKSVYVTAGYRVKNFTPYVTYSQIKPEGDPYLVTYDQKTTSTGVRWDLMKNMDLKLQWDRVSLGSKNVGYFTNAQPGLAGSTVNIVGVALDFVF